jgi:hypothetical protein
MDGFRALLADDAVWGDDPAHPRTCHGRDAIVATYEQLLADGVRGRVVETAAGPRGVACLLAVEWPEADRGARASSITQVFLVRDGLVTKIEGYDDWATAVAAISA